MWSLILAQFRHVPRMAQLATDHQGWNPVLATFSNLEARKCLAHWPPLAFPRNFTVLKLAPL